jgi:predicted RecA/RadA family phage recombinase
MARNFVQPGDVITLTAPSAVRSGGVVNVGAFVGVAAFDAAQGQEVEVSLVGVFELPKASGALAQGALVFWDGTHVVGEGELLIGAVVDGAGAAATVARVRLNGVTT